MGKYSRVDGRRSSNCCSTLTAVVFVAFCLIGVWMLMSSYVPVQNSEELQSQEPKREPKQRITENGSTQFEDGSVELPEDATRGDGNTENSKEERNTDVQGNQKQSGNEPENTEDEHHGVKISVEGTNERIESEEESKREAEKDESRKREDMMEVNSKNEDSKSDTEETKTEAEKGVGADSNANVSPDESLDEQKSNPGEGEKKSETEEVVDGTKQEDNIDTEREEEKREQYKDKSTEQNISETPEKGQDSHEDFVSGAQLELLNETTAQNGAWSTQAVESENEKKSQKYSLSKDQNVYEWKLCNVTAGPDYIPCLDNLKAIRKLHSTKHYEHRERHCPDEAPTCLVALPEGYKTSVKWPKSREKIWYHNVPHLKLAEVKGHQNWVKFSGEYLTFPGGGTQFKHGALHYIDFIQQSHPDIAWGKRSRVILDVGCGVASFGAYLFDRDVLAMSFAPKDEHEAQVQFALERGIPSISAVMGTKRLPFPSRVFDLVHCARCRVPWHIEGGKLLLELNRVLRPGGYFVWSATPVYQKLPEDAGIWQAMSRLTKSMCWELVVVKKDRLNGVGAAIYRKPTSNECYERRSHNEPPLCEKSDDPNAAWNVPLQACMHEVPVDASERGALWPEKWPLRLEKAPYWLKSSQTGVYGKPAPEDFAADYEHWKHVVSHSYLNGLGISWSSVRNVMDMRAVYGGFAAALKDLKVWVMNVVPINSPDTLPIIYERGLFGIYHDWCQSFSTYPRSYDLLHADHLFSVLKQRCQLVGVIVEVDRILRPDGKLIVRDDIETIREVESMARSLRWEIRLTYSKDSEGLLCVQKTKWRPTESQTIMSAIA